MVVLDRVREELVEPVGITVLSLAQIVGTGLRSVGQTILTSNSVVLGNQLVHLTIDTAGSGIGSLSIVQVTFLLHFLIDAHLILRVHDVEGGIAGLQTHGVLTSVVDAGLTLLTLLGGDNDHTSHSAGTIDRGSRTVLQNIEGLDIVGVQTCDGAGDQGVGITARQIVGRYVGHILHDHTVDHPEGLRVTIDRGSTTYADLRSSTEST